MSARALLAVVLLGASPALAQLGPPTSPTLPGGTPTITPPDRTGNPPTVRPPLQIRAPLAPSISSVTAVALANAAIVAPRGAPPAPNQDASVSVVLGNLGDAESFEVTDFGSDCGWHPPPSLVQQRNFQSNQLEFGTFRQQGVFTWRNDSGCRISVTVRMKRAGLPPELPITLTSAPIALTGGRNVTIEVTGGLASRFGFQNPSPSIGVCSGVSTGTLPGSQSRTVGLSTASDVRINVRSGPLGTFCRWRSEAFELPPGVRLVELLSHATASDVVQEGSPAVRRATCGVEGIGMESGAQIFARGSAVGRPRHAFARGTVPFPVGRYTSTGQVLRPVTRSGYPPLLTADDVILLSETEPRTRYRSMLVPLLVELECGPTATNDHHAELTLERLTFFVPDNVRFP